MDPDAALDSIDSLLRAGVDDDDAADALYELADGLHGWLARGGFVPKGWRGTRPGLMGFCAGLRLFARGVYPRAGK